MTTEMIPLVGDAIGTDNAVVEEAVADMRIGEDIARPGDEFADGSATDDEATADMADDKEVIEEISEPEDGFVLEVEVIDTIEISARTEKGAIFWRTSSHLDQDPISSVLRVGSGWMDWEARARGKRQSCMRGAASSTRRMIIQELEV